MENTIPPREPRPPDENPAAPRRDSGNTTDATEQSSAKAAVGALFRSAREAQGLSQAQVAYLTNDSQGQISRTTISDIERGVSFPNLEVLVSLSKVLHMEPVEAIERVELAMAPPVDLTDAPLELLRMRAEVLF